MRSRIKLTITYIIPFVLLLVSGFQLFLQPTFLNTNDTSTMEALLDGTAREPISGFYFQGGAISQMLLTEKILKEIEDPSLPNDSQPEEIKNRLGRVLLGQRLQISFYVFLAILSVTSFLSLYFRAFFYAFLNRILYFFGFIQGLFSMPNIALAGASSGRTEDLFWVIPSLFFAFAWIIGMVYLMFTIGKLYSEENADRFYSLKNLREDESEFRSESNRKGSYATAFLHFLGIVALGTLIGNIVYIPLFVLQKNYPEPFGILIAGTVIAISAFYIRNYLKFGRSPELSTYQNLALGISYLQVRFIRITLMIFLVLVLVFVFILFLYYLLTINFEFLESLFPAIDSRQNL
ncbi:hypothetical protein EHQ52_08790 [Leptospira koniambonensis]|uniref:Uncharacterized protein n=1 Tax=Leptospira koniambonensis TaxID=2484950 RepID=A0A4R9J873_9LEPT|nr:hypothetical protein [Leptospira koniambonensis]TGL34585.1 hypothetical protein EHQ52_08790 [Leptospira koniambonensis]